MRPNSPHTVYSTAHSVVHGGHFIATSTLGDTLCGLVHCLMGEKVVTNTSHPDTVLLLLRFVHYFHSEFVMGNPDFDNLPGHLPDLTTWGGFQDFLNLCSIAVFFNVLNPGTYQLPSSADEVDEYRYEDYDLNTISTPDRRRFAFARGLTCQLIEWLDAHFVVGSSSGAGGSSNSTGAVPSCLELFRRHLIHHGLYLVEYRRALDEEDDEVVKHSNEECNIMPARLSELPKLTHANLRKQIRWAICTIPGMTEDAWKAAFDGAEQVNFMFNEEQSRYLPFPRDKPAPFTAIPLAATEEIYALGLTEGDSKYFGAEFGYPVMRAKRPLEDGASASSPKRPRRDVV